MVIDTSALLAVLRDEPESDAFIHAIANHPDPIISAATLVEARIVVEARLGPDGTDRLNQLLEAGGVRVVAFDGAQSLTAHRACSGSTEHATRHAASGRCLDKKRMPTQRSGQHRVFRVNFQMGAQRNT